MIDKTYNPDSIENKWYQLWESKQYFKPSGEGTSYSMMIPPPNVTGSLHMGHGFQYALMDALVRYQRMSGSNTLWQVGYDHAGIATQIMVEKQLAKKNISRHDLGREQFVEKVWQWKHESGNTISQQMRRIGISVDWDRERFTMDDGLSNAVKEVFVKLHDEGLIYRGKRLVNWDPKLLTAISDLEVISVEEQGSLWHIRYPLVDSNDHIIVATTRPETMLGDVAVAVNPEDERYQHLIGKYLQLPLTDRKIPIIADDYVEKDFGSGCVKITPGHDFNDYEIGQRHSLAKINIFTPQAQLNENVPEAYQGLDRFVARKQIIADLEAQGLMDKIEPHQLKIPRCERSNEVVEPYLTDQWFVKAKPLAEPAIKAVERGDIKFYPDNWQKTYFQWMNNIEDWCISRQLWWGHRIPAWYDDAGNIYVAKDEAEVRKKYKLADDFALQQDNDVLDTWFSSALWPFSTLGWPEKTKELETFYPTSVLITGFDIIFFWIARMIMMGLKFTDKVPFSEVYITGLVRDHEGKKMSKTKGNVIDPIDLIDGIELEELVEKRTSTLFQAQLEEKVAKATRKQFPEGIKGYGTDALRFTYCALATTGRDIRFELNRLEGYRNFCNKLWNAARYVMMNTENHSIASDEASLEFSLADRWIQTRLQQTINTAHEHFKNYRFDLLTQTLYDFTWHDYCDWYLELSKPMLGENASEAQQQATRYTLIHVLENLLRLLHPIIPFITEEIWQKIAPMCGKSAETIMLQSYPQQQTEKEDTQSISSIEWLKQFIIGIRNIRGEMNISPNKPLNVLLRHMNQQDVQQLTTNKPLLMSMAKLDSIEQLADDCEPPASATAFIAEMEIHIPMAGLIDQAAESQRISKELAKLEKEIERAQSKLANLNFTDKAPPAVVAKEQERMNELSLSMEKLKQQMQRMKELG